MATRSMVCLADFEKYAAEILPKNAFDYYRNGADGELTLHDNIRAFARRLIMPRVLRNVSCVKMGTSILGHKVAFPVCVAPTAKHKMAHPEGEIATARACASMGVGFMLSSLATSSIEDVAEGALSGLRFFQMYIYKQREITKWLIARAERSGYKALVLTLDTPLLGKRLADNRNMFKLPSHLKMANFQKLEFKGSDVNEGEDEPDLEEYVSPKLDSSLTWADIDWLKSVTQLPIILKGILTAEDAHLAAEKGIAGIIVSNHGARQLDTVPATLDVLPSVVSAVAGRCEVFLDGGVRCGTDVFKALALGARVVFIGRPAIYGLAYNGEDGVRQVLSILQNEFRTAMALAGISKVEDIKREMVIHVSQVASKL